MQQTEQYQLNQWELSDRVRMEDFNADNTKLEAALAGLQTGLSGLGTNLSGLSGSISGINTALAGKCGRLQQFKSQQAITNSEGKKYVASSLGVTNWNTWDCALWFFDLHETTFQGGEKITFALNQSSGTIDDYQVTLDGGSVVLALFPMSDKMSTVKGFVLGAGAYPLVIPVTFDSIIGFTIRKPTGATSTFHNVTMTAVGLK